MSRSRLEFVSIHFYGQGYVVRTRRVAGSFERFCNTWRSRLTIPEVRAFHLCGSGYMIVRTFPHSARVPEKIAEQVTDMWRMHHHTASPNVPLPEKPDVIPFEDVA